MCRGEFEKGWSDNEAGAEYAERFTDEAERNEERDLVCEDCYQKIMNQ